MEHATLREKLAMTALLHDVTGFPQKWFDWCNARRRHSTLENVPPDELEAACYAALETPSHPLMAPKEERHRTGDGLLLVVVGGSAYVGALAFPADEAEVLDRPG